MANDRKIYFVIVAAGGGTRFGGDIPKQFRRLAGKTVVCHSIDTFNSYCNKENICGSVIIVLSPAGRKFWSETEATAYSDVLIAMGGASRADSVANALGLIGGVSGEDIIMVHDGARPLMSEALLARLTAAIDNGANAVVPAIAPTDSLMVKADGDGALPVRRSDYLAVQTPQAFSAETLICAYKNQQDNLSLMTDDASVVHAASGQPVSYVDGEVTNIKITNPADLPLAEILLELCSR